MSLSRVCAAATAAGIILATGRLLATPQAKTSLYQESRTTVTRDNQTQIVTRRIWIKYPASVRMEESLGPQQRLTVSNGKELWIALPSVKKGQHRTLTPAEAAQFAKQLKVDLDMAPSFLKAGGKKIRQEKVNGVMCDLYQRAKPGQLTLSLWIDAGGRHLAVKQEESGVVRAADRMGEPMKTHILKSTTDYVKWQIDQPIDDSKFKAPAGVTYEEYKRPATGSAPAPKR
jgi:outer membrane lipoprotein-sorting protein